MAQSFFVTAQAYIFRKITNHEMRQKRALYTLVYVLLTIVVVFAALHITVTFYLNDKIKEGLKTEVDKQTNGEYLLHINQLKINIFNQSVSVIGFELTPVKNIRPTSIKYAASANEIHLIDFEIWPFILHNKLMVEKMKMLNPAVIIFRNTAHKQKTSRDSSKKFSIYSLLNKHIDALSIGRIKIRNAKLQVFNTFTDSVPSISTNNNELTIANFQVNEKAEQEKRLFIADTCQLIINKFAYVTANNLSTLRINKITASYLDSTLLLDSVQLIPNYSKKVYALKAGQQTDRVAISVWQASFYQMDVRSFFERNEVKAERLKISDFSLSAYRDKNDPRINKRVKSVQEALKSIPVLTNIEKIQLDKGLVEYEEVAKGAKESGKISFHQMNGTMIGFTSDPVLFSKNKFNVDLNCRFMGVGKLEAHYSFPLNTNKMVFDFSAKLSEMPLREMNKILLPHMHVSIKDGIVDSTIIAFHASDISSTGTIRIVHRELKIELLDKSNRPNFFHRVISSVVQSILQKKSSNNGGMGKIHYERNPNRFIFHYTWKSVLSGLKSSFGLPDKKKKESDEDK